MEITAYERDTFGNLISEFFGYYFNGNWAALSAFFWNGFKFNTPDSAKGVFYGKLWDFLPVPIKDMCRKKVNE